MIKNYNYYRENVRTFKTSEGWMTKDIVKVSRSHFSPNTYTMKASDRITEVEINYEAKHICGIKH